MGRKVKAIGTVGYTVDCEKITLLIVLKVKILSSLRHSHNSYLYNLVKQSIRMMPFLMCITACFL